MHSKKQKKSYPRRRKKVARKVEKKSPNKLKKKSPNKLKKTCPKKCRKFVQNDLDFWVKKKSFFCVKIVEPKDLSKRRRLTPSFGGFVHRKVCPTASCLRRQSFFFCTVSRKLICESKNYKFGGFKHAFFVACTAHRAEAGLTHRNAELQRSWK